MERTIKSWGQKWALFKNDLCEVSYLKLSPMQRCSWHKHQTKFNLFFVISGQLTLKSEYRSIVLEQYQFGTTRPGEMHEFQTDKKPTTIIEVMFVQYDDKDIIRENKGGKKGKT